jgi:hypothetical protein
VIIENGDSREGPRHLDCAEALKKGEIPREGDTLFRAEARKVSLRKLNDPFQPLRRSLPDALGEPA